MGRDIILEQTIAQLGGTGLHGALAYTGTRHLIMGKDYIGLVVNGKPGQRWMIKITLDFSDTYIVEMIASRGDKSEQLDRKDWIYCDELQAEVEQMYDKAIKKHNHGFIPLR